MLHSILFYLFNKSNLILLLDRPFLHQVLLSMDNDESTDANQPLNPNAAHSNAISLATLAKTISKFKRSARHAYNRKNIVHEDQYFWTLRLAMLMPAFIGNTLSISPFVEIKVQKEANHFIINCSYGDIEWSIKRKLGAFFKLHAELTSMKFGRRDLPSLPDFPIERREQADQPYKIQVYLQRLIANFTFTHLEYDILSFFSVSSHSFLRAPLKPLELNLKAHHLVALPTHLKIFHWTGYVSVYGVVFDTCLVLFAGQWNKDILAILILDQSFRITMQHKSKLNPNIKLELSNYFNHLNIKLNKHESHLFYNYINKMTSTSIYSNYHRYDSFAPVRNGGVTYFIDSCNYFNALFDCLESANKSIYIADWWLTPELYLKRPYAKNEHTRLDRVLLRAAERNVSIYILIYKEFNIALPNDSEHTKQYLNQLHHNIHVQRHPDHFTTNGSLLWSHHEKFVVVDDMYGFVGGMDLCLGRWTRQLHLLLDDSEDMTDRMLPGQDYNNARLKDFNKVRTRWDKDIISREEPRMPWHDIHSQIQGESVLDLILHFVQYWNHGKLSKTKGEIVPYLMPNNQRCKMKISNDFVTTQVIRSASAWSIGQPVEKSILNAYISLIQNAKSFIYIENQFFISNANNSEYVHNTIARELVNRIKSAHFKGEVFRVYLLIPLFPGFQFDLKSEQGNTAKLILQFQFDTISRGEDSIYGLLQRDGIDPNLYFRVFGLRNYAIKEGHLAMHEQIYIHSKLIIVDDEKCLVGSANINDRSMVGDRDSEVAVVSEYKTSDYLESMMHIKNPIKQLRIDLWKEHLGDISINIDDPISEESWVLWATRSNANTNIYRSVFNPYPDDLMTTFKDMQNAGDFIIKEIELKELEELKSIRGHVVEFPVWFLKKQKQINDGLGIETLVPGELFI